MINITEDRLKELLENFNNWVSCRCSECRCDANAHAVDEWKSMENLYNYILEETKDK